MYINNVCSYVYYMYIIYFWVQGEQEWTLVIKKNV